MRVRQEDKRTLQRLIKLFKPYKKNIIIIFICMLSSAVVNTLVPIISKRIVDDGLIQNNFNLLIKLVALSLLLVLIDQGIGFIETRYRVLISSIMPYELSKRAFKQTMKLKLGYFNNTNSAAIMNNINMDVGNISKIANSNLFFIVSQVFKMIGGIVGLFIIDWKLTLVVLAVLPVKYKLVKLLAKQRQKLFSEYMEANSDYSEWYGDTVAGVREVKLLGIDRLKTGEFIKKQRRLIKVDIKMNVLDKLNELSESVLFEIITGLLYILGAYMILKANFTVGGLMAFITYSVYVTTPISAILNIGYTFSDVIPSAKRFFEFLDTDREKELGKTFLDLPFESLKFENVSFQYSEENKVLKGISFEIKKGEKVAVIGSNGAGKTTLINLLLRFLEPDGGRILIDDIDIAHIRLREYRQMISVVSQNAYLFNTTVRENIIPFSKNNDIKLRMIAKKSRIEDLIEELPQKYDTFVGSNGANLSGGQRQKIAMARAIAKESKILVLDEATSNYDIESEMEMADLIVNQLEDKTVLMVTHKLPILKALDKIVFIEDGKVAALGKHEELYQNNKVYRDIINNFNQDFKEKSDTYSLSI
ncbi:MAG TPA: ABC transporter ATP-binding protein [Acetivibrio sp.]|uniref:ABC transporter ATP-binding protein n=1 Tax=Acetivibrio sp. TaxID=1872092 RepID=UPI002C7016F3|nr:ABC transporter ATP-binding protein [Acetivibrio sp.]HOM03453.1 ABC transporter ATP-binding protein [Acetivibrio sp.]